MRIGNHEFDTKNETYIMGILNVTPDSFSDGGKFNHMDAALAHAEQMIRDGADIIDIGGESTRPGHTVISDEEEIARVTPVIEAVKSHFDVPVSIDTYKGNVAEAALQAGADLVNDIWGFKFDYKTAEVTARYHAACCLMHNRNEAIYQNFLEDMVADMKECVAIAHKAGVPDDKIMLDPGVGFGKTYEQNLEAINHVDVLQTPDSSRHFQKICHRQHPGSAGRSARGRNTCHHRDRHAPRMLLCPGTRYQRKPPDHSDDESDPVLLGGNLWIK